MRKGMVKISKCLLQNLLNFPPGWRIEEMTCIESDDVITAVISGNDFPEMVPIKQCEIIFHKEFIRLEVKEAP